MMRAIVQLMLLSGLTIFLFFASHAQSPSMGANIDSLIVEIDTAKIIDAVEPRPSLETSIRRIEEYTRKINLIDQTLEKGMDTIRINEMIPRMNRFVTNVDGRLTENDDAHSLRLVSALEYLVDLAKDRATEVNLLINERMDELVLAKAQFDSIRSDDVMRYSLRDSTMLPEFQSALNTLKQKIFFTDSLLNANRLLTATYQYQVNSITDDIERIADAIKSEKRYLERNTYRREMNYIWDPTDFPQTNKLSEIFTQSMSFNFLIINSYVNEHLPLTVFFLIVILLVWRWVFINLREIKISKEFSDIIFSRLRYLHRYPLLSSILVVLAIATFFYPKVPQSFSSFLVFLTVTISGIMLRKRVSPRTLRLWVVMYIIFILNMLSKLYWDVAYQERWYLLLFNLLSILVTFKVYKHVKIKEENIPAYLSPIILTFIGFQILSLLANFTGRFSLSKIMGVTGTLGMMHAISLVIFVIVIKEIIYVQIEVSRKDYAGYTSSLDFQGIQTRINSFFTFLAVAIWGKYFLDSLYILDFILDFSMEFLQTQRSILNATFRYDQILVFVLAIYFSAVISNITAFFASIKDERDALSRNKRLGSSILLIRLGIFTLGIVIAFAASGIPIDKIAIVLGALSVGIGFGLQTIVNNLVSGIILAFERPIQIGDTVQVGQVEGIVKEIGIRSSKIKNWDGADIIIPNGDMLANHLINWTLSDKKRRVELLIGVAYQSDMDQVTQLIEAELANEEILKYPASRVFLQEFADNSVNFRVLFWVNDVEVWITIRDKMMRAIFRSFQENGVEIPFPQRDIHVKSFPGLIQEKIFRPEEPGNQKDTGDSQPQDSE